MNNWVEICFFKQACFEYIKILTFNSIKNNLTKLLFVGFLVVRDKKNAIQAVILFPVFVRKNNIDDLWSVLQS